MRTRNLAVAIVAVALTVGACDTLTGLFSGDDSRLAIIEWAASDGASSMVLAAGDTVDLSTGIEAPDTVAVGEAFTAEISTWEPNGCWDKDRTEVENGALDAHIRPYNRDTNDGTQGCPTGVVEIVHTAGLSFTEPGDAVLTVTGLRVTGGEVGEATTVTREKTIHVR